METLITVEIATGLLFIGLAMIVGYQGNKVGGAAIFVLFAAFVSLLVVAGTLLAGFFLIEDVGVLIGSLMEAAFILIGMATLLGYVGNRMMGAAVLGIGAAGASIVCIASTFVGYALGGDTGAWVGLLAGIVLAGVIVVPPLPARVIRGRSARFLVGVWCGFCALSIFGYLAGEAVGLLTITLPTIALFWGGLYRISAYILPLRDGSQRSQAFRSLLTFCMGTNYPYYFVDEQGKLDTRVDGDRFLQLFAGPGLVYTGCDHAAYITNGVANNRVFEPGLSFTDVFDLPPKIIDLRPQLRAFEVEALTKDGIPIGVLTFTSFRLDAGGQEVLLGQSFPLRRRAVFEVVTKELVEKSGVKYEWNGQLVPVIATRIVQDIISRYTVDELCAALDPGRNPRVEIVAEMKNKMQDVLRPWGIEYIGGGISNLIPRDSAVVERRLDSWRTQWMSNVLASLDAGKAERVRQLELAQAEAETEIVLRLSQIVEESMRSGSVSQTAVALRFIDSLGEFVGEAGAYGEVPEGVEKTLNRLRGQIEEGDR
jgi:hypothetical protein